MLKDAHLDKILNILRLCPSIRIGKEEKARLFIEDVFRMLRTGCQWRELPAKYGKRNSVYKRFSRWSDIRIWEYLFCFFSRDADMGNLFPDSTIVRAHSCASGVPKSRGGRAAQASGRSKGGFTTKIHAAAESLGLPLRLILTPGQRHDSTQALALTDGFKYKRLVADKSYDSDNIIDSAYAIGAEVVIPPRSNRIVRREYDTHIYKEHHLIECFFQ